MIKEEIDFLDHSNRIEREYSKNAMEDAVKCWKFVKKTDKPMDRKLIKKVHKKLMERINPEIAGKFRRIQVGVVTQEGFKEAIHWSHIDHQLINLCEVNPMTEEAIKKWHIDFEHIHPFEDGNGRTGRILMNLQRMRAGLPLIIIHEGKEQMEYYKWFG
jgi:Fic family protein